MTETQRERNPTLPHLSVALTLICLFTGISACAPLSQNAGETPSQDSCSPEFPDKDGWLGGDSAYSIPLTPTKSIWFFGDSFIATAPSQERSDAAFVANTIGISTCTDGKFQIDYTFGGTPTEPMDFFGPVSANISYWPLSSFLHEGRLFVFLQQVKRRSGAGAFDFDIVGVDLAEISNPLRPPSDWFITLRPIYHGQDLIPGIASIKSDHYVYLYSVRHTAGSANRDVLLQRFRLKDLNEPEAEIDVTTYQKGGAWAPAIEHAAPLMREGATEMSLRYDEHLKKWIAVMPSVNAFASHANYRSSPTLSGPWSKARPLLAYTELKDDSPDSEDVFCYAAKEHPQFAPEKPRSILLTYVCNTTDETVLTRTDLYRPIALRVKLPSSD